MARWTWSLWVWSVAAVAAPAPELVREVSPSWPRTERREASTEVVCDARVTVDDRGVPVVVDVDACPFAFALEAGAAVQQWRWSAVAAGAPHRVQLEVRFSGATDTASPD